MAEFPPELWDEVAFFLPAADILSLAQTSREFNSVFIPRLLYAQRLDVPQSVSVEDFVTKGLVIPRNGGPLDPLRLFAVSFDVKEVDDLRWRLFAGYQHTPQDIHKHHARLERILGRMERVRRAKISFETQNHFGLWYESHQNLAAAVANLEKWKEIVMKWKNSMNNILNMLLSKGCDRIVVEDGGYPTLTSHSDPVGQPSTHNIVDVSVPDEVFAHARVSHLGISGQMFFNPPCLTWTRSILQLSTLTRLVLYQVAIVPAHWENIFSFMTPVLCGKLQYLSISACRYLPLFPLINFVTSLKALRGLRLLDRAPFVTANKGSLQNLHTQSYPLPELRSLHAFIDWVCFLCPRPKSTEETNSKLTYVRIIPREENDAIEGLFHYKDSYPIFSKAILGLDEHSAALKSMSSRGLLPSPSTHPCDQWQNGCIISLDLTARTIADLGVTPIDNILNTVRPFLFMDYGAPHGEFSVPFDPLASTYDGPIIFPANKVDPYVASATLFQRNPSDYPAYEKINEIAIRGPSLIGDKKSLALNPSVVSRYLALWKGVEVVKIGDAKSGHDGEEEWEECVDGNEARNVVDVDKMSDGEFYEARAMVLESAYEPVWKKSAPGSATLPSKEFVLKRSMVQVMRKNAPHVKRLSFRDGVITC